MFNEKKDNKSEQQIAFEKKYKLECFVSQDILGNSQQDFGYHRHVISSNDETMIVITLSNELSKFLSRMKPDYRRACVAGFVQETKDHGGIYYFKKNDNTAYLMTLIQNGESEILHVEKTGT